MCNILSKRFIKGVYISNKPAFELDRKSSDPEIRKRAISWLKRRKYKLCTRYKGKYKKIIKEER